MSKWRLVEAEVAAIKVEVEVNGQIEETPITSLRPTAHNPAFGGSEAAKSGTVKKRRSSRAAGSVLRERSGTLDDYGLENDESYQAMSSEDLQYACHLACNNVEYLFSQDSLVVKGDMYLRSLMDNQGYVPLLYIMQYPDLMYSPASLNDIMLMLQSNPKCTLEVDTVNATVRLKENWSSYLLRNNQGSMGLSQRWIASDSASTSASDAGAPSSAPIPMSNKALSPSAQEFVSSSPAAGSPLRANAFEFVPK
jgi:hypothetical protein